MDAFRGASGAMNEEQSLRAKLASAEDSLQEVEQKYQKAMRGLESLTPNGSEYVDNPDGCVAHVKDRYESNHELICKLKRERDEAQKDSEAFLFAWGLLSLFQKKHSLKALRMLSSEMAERILSVAAGRSCLQQAQEVE